MLSVVFFFFFYSSFHSEYNSVTIPEGVQSVVEEPCRQAVRGRTPNLSVPLCGGCAGQAGSPAPS